MIASMILFLGLLSMVSGQVMEGLVQLDKSSIDKVRSPPILGHHLKPFVQQVSEIALIKLGTKSTQALCTGGKQRWEQQTNRDQPCHTEIRSETFESRNADLDAKYKKTVLCLSLKQSNRGLKNWLKSSFCLTIFPATEFFFYFFPLAFSKNVSFVKSPLFSAAALHTF